LFKGCIFDGFYAKAFLQNSSPYAWGKNSATLGNLCLQKTGIDEAQLHLAGLNDPFTHR